MRILVLTRGIRASGKSAWIKEMGLSEYAISVDSIRLMLSSPDILPRVETPSCAYQITNKYNKAIRSTLLTLLEIRLRDGCFTIIDDTHIETSLLRSYEALTKKYHYRTLVVDFSHVPLQTIIDNNAKMLPYQALPIHILESMYQTLQYYSQKPLPPRYSVYKYDQILHTKYAKSILNFSPKNLSSYAQIHHIGDIHGCFDTLLTYLIYTNSHTPTHSLSKAKDMLERSHFSSDICMKFLNPSIYYIFLGDYIDRGVQNAYVVRFLLGIMNLKNVHLLEGNHERWLDKWGKEEIISNHFSATIKDLEKNGLKPEDTNRLYAKLKQCAYYHYRGKKVLCTHGGLSTMPTNLLLVPTNEIIYGSGEREEMPECARIFTENTARNTFQIFGHRNKEKCPMRLHKRNFALEGGVEYGGALRIAVLKKDSAPLFTYSATAKHTAKKYAKLHSLMGAIESKDNFVKLYAQNRHNLKARTKYFSLLKGLFGGL